ncbi:hypothetical protein [Actinomadura rubrisoli]|uniref:Uncharacterized protein n=1 Tax=Actinomadura rubrisoli TaxID=2530368 RepID=A0A4R5A0B0_9ACTN|nr:hypothetical protein [Actinomadura rubrisoli]TDD64310.1 hypothetical protein E1298_42530 [Actinomadura rubrisoli]
MSIESMLVDVFSCVKAARGPTRSSGAGGPPRSNAHPGRTPSSPAARPPPISQWRGFVRHSQNALSMDRAAIAVNRRFDVDVSIASGIPSGELKFTFKAPLPLMKPPVYLLG